MRPKWTVGTTYVVRDQYDSEGGWVTREGVSSVCWVGDEEVFEHKAGQHLDRFRCKKHDTSWNEPHR